MNRKGPVLLDNLCTSSVLLVDTHAQHLLAFLNVDATHVISAQCFISDVFAILIYLILMSIALNSFNIEKSKKENQSLNNWDPC